MVASSPTEKLTSFTYIQHGNQFSNGTGQNSCPVPEPDKVLDRDGMWLSSSRAGQPVPELGSRFRNRVAKLSSSGTGPSSRLGRNIDMCVCVCVCLCAFVYVCVYCILMQ